FSADAPCRPLDAASEIENFGIGLVEPDVQCLQNRVPEPLEVRRGSMLKLFERSDAVSIHESLQIALRDKLGRGPPDNLSFKFESLQESSPFPDVSCPLAVVRCLM